MMKNHMAAADVDLLQVPSYVAVACCHGVALELIVHVFHGFPELAAIRLAGGDLESCDAAPPSFVSRLRRQGEGSARGEKRGFGVTLAVRGPRYS